MGVPMRIPRLAISLLAFAALVVTAGPGRAATLITAGAYGDAEYQAHSGSLGLGPGRYRFDIAFTTPVLYVTGNAGKSTVSSFYCTDPDVGPGEFYCGGDDVPTLAPFDPVDALTYRAFLTVNPPADSFYPPEAIVTRIHDFDICCDYAFEFESVRAGSFRLTYAAVPEPESWMLMILGFAVVGAAWRHSSRARRSAPLLQRMS